MHIRSIAFLFLLLALTTNAFAQEGYEHLSPLSHGAGRTYVVNSRGLDAVGLNPALLALGSPTRKTWEFSAFPVSSLGADAGASFLSDKLTQLANNTANLDSGYNSAIDLLRNDGLSGRGDVRIFGAYYHNATLGGLSFSFTTHSGIRTRIPSGVLDFIGGGNFIKFADTVLNIDNIDAQGLWYNSWTASYGRYLVNVDGLKFSAGAAVKYIQGLGYLRLEEGAYFNTRPLSEQRIRMETNYSLRYAFIDVFDRSKSNEDISVWDVFSGSAGSGFGFDVGAALMLGGDSTGPGFIFASSINDIGSITWTENTIERRADKVVDTIYYQAANNDITDTLSALAGRVTRTGSFTTHLPTTLRVGASMNFRNLGILTIGPEITLAAELTTGVTSVIGSNDTRIGLGAIAAWHVPSISIRTAAGVISEADVIDVSLGLGATILDYVSIDVSSARLGQVFGAGAGRSDIALGLKVHL